MQNIFILILYIVIIIVPSTLQFQSWFSLYHRNLQLQSSTQQDSSTTKPWMKKAIKPFIPKVLINNVTIDPSNLKYINNIRKVNHKYFLRSISPDEERFRLQSFRSLRKRMFDLVRGEGCDSRRGWIRAFERWQFISTSSKYSTDIELLIPSGTIKEMKSANDYLFNDLCKLENLSEKGAKYIANQITKESKILSIALQSYKNNLTGIPEVINAFENQYYGMIELKPQSNEFAKCSSIISDNQNLRSVSISFDHTLKLFLLWKAYPYNEIVNHTNYQENPTFLRDVYVLLMRYQSCESFGYHAAVTEHVMENLIENFDICVECFASPLNCYLPNYCSAYPDSDRAFGSLGSFFNFKPTSGSYQCNPPFSDIIMQQTIRHIESLLCHSDELELPLSFVIIVPIWETDLFWEKLIESPYYRRHITINVEEYCYYDGSQHLISIDEKRYRPGFFNSSVFFLQNDLGSNKWYASDDKMKSLESAWGKVSMNSSKESFGKQTVPYIPKRLRSN